MPWFDLDTHLTGLETIILVSFCLLAGCAIGIFYKDEEEIDDAFSAELDRQERIEEK